MSAQKQEWIARTGANPRGEPNPPPYTPALGARLYEARARGQHWSAVCAQELWPADHGLSAVLAIAGRHAKRYAYDNRLPWPIMVPYRQRYTPPLNNRPPIRDWLILTDGPARFASELPAAA